MKIALAVCGFLFGAFLVALFGGILGGGAPEWFGTLYLFLLIPANVVVFALFEGFGLTIDDLGWFALVIALSVPIFTPFWADISARVGVARIRRRRKRSPKIAACPPRRV